MRSGNLCKRSSHGINAEGQARAFLSMYCGLCKETKFVSQLKFNEL